MVQVTAEARCWTRTGGSLPQKQQACAGCTLSRFTVAGNQITRRRWHRVFFCLTYLPHWFKANRHRLLKRNGRGYGEGNVRSSRHRRQTVFSRHIAYPCGMTWQRYMPCYNRISRRLICHINIFYIEKKVWTQQHFPIVITIIWFYKFYLAGWREDLSYMEVW